MNCSLIIRAYNEAAHIGRLLEGVRHQTIKDVEILLVDSGSTDSTPMIARQYGAEVVHIDPAEFTFGRSLNRGLAASKGELVVIASAHVYPVYPDWLERLLEPFSDPGLALAYGRQRGDESSMFSEQLVFARWYPDQPDRQQAGPFCNNANAAIRRSIWEGQPYDESLTGLEDLAWGKQAQERGYAIAYVPEAEVVHLHQETPGGVMNRYRREGMAFKRIYPEAHFNLYDFLRNSFSSISFDLLHAVRKKVLLRNLSGIFWFRLAQFWGTYQGYRQSSPLTPELRQTFYYHVGWEKDRPTRRAIDPIDYKELKSNGK